VNKKIKTAGTLLMLTLYCIINLLVFNRTSFEVNNGHMDAMVFASGELSAPEPHTLPDFKFEIQVYVTSFSMQQAISLFSASLNLLSRIDTAFFVSYQEIFEHFPLLRLKAERLYPFHFFF
jgi:hypothetical protein